VLTVRALETAQAFTMLGAGGLTPPERERFVQRSHLVALEADEDDHLAGVAVADADPATVRVVALEGGPAACRLLLERLAWLAEDRPVTGWFPTDRPDLVTAAEGEGFVRGPEYPGPGGAVFMFHAADR
jgi:hypothetical protein